MGSTLDLGQNFGEGLYEAEARYFINDECATQADHILWRRTKLGVHLFDAQIAGFQQWVDGAMTT